MFYFTNFNRRFHGASNPLGHPGKKCNLMRCVWLGLMILFSISTKAQDGFVKLQISVSTDSGSKVVPLAGANVLLYRGDALVSSDSTGKAGMLYYNTLTAGSYVIICYKTGFLSDTSSVELSAENNPELPIMLSVGKYKIIDIFTDKKKKEDPPLGPIHQSGGPKLKTDDFINRAGDDPKILLAKTNPKIIQTPGGFSFMGSRIDANKSFVDGAIDDGSGINGLGTAQLGSSIIGIPANKGDFTGGSFEWVTRSATIKHIFATEAQTSWHLDPFGYQSLAGFASGPIKITKYKDADGHTQQYIKLGYVLNGQLKYQKDASPSVIGVYMLTPESQARLEVNPLTITPTGTVYSAAYLQASDFAHVKAHPNSSGQSGNFFGKLEFTPKQGTMLTAFARFTFNQGLAASNSIMNYAANARNDNRALLSYIQFTQNLRSSESNPIQGAYYTLRAEYYNQFAQTRDAAHLDNIFDYGNIGVFNTYSSELFNYSTTDNNPNKEPRQVRDQNGKIMKLRNYWEQTGYVDTLLTFSSSGLNPIRANYTQSVYNMFEQRGTSIQNSSQLLNNLGLLNGYNPNAIYSLWAAPGTITSGWSQSSTQRYSIFAQGQFRYSKLMSEGKRTPTHEIQFGFFCEQQILRGYNLNANGLWQLMGQLMNRHISQLDKSHPILSYDANGVFTDTVRYNRLVNYAEQSHFDRAFRDKLISQGAKDINGKTIDERTFVNINSYAPGEFKLNYFSADELLNNGNSYAGYYGYNYLGQKQKGKISLDDFLNNPERRAIDAFRPIYTAAWVQDQFRFKDLIFRFGLRAERYDANQYVLADPYSLYPIKTAAEVKTINGMDVQHPANIGNSFKVYVDDEKSPTKIIGYRNGDRWFNADGSEQKNPEFLANQSSSGRIAPLLSNPNQQQLGRSSLKDYVPVINVLPRIWFSFPLVPEKQIFYVAYDVLVQRPNSSASFLSIDQLYYLKNRQGSTIANGELSARIRTNYEVGYKHILGDSRRKANDKSASEIELSVNYSEIRKDFGLYRMSQAYPVSYITYRNIDFATVTGFQAAYAVKGKGPLSFYVGYMLQYADGTGSNINSQSALIASNQPNLRNIIPLGELDVRHNVKATVTWIWEGGYDKVRHRPRYTGPQIAGWKVFENTNINITGNAYSGLPYTPTTRPVQIGATDRAQVKGVPFGARMPWQYFMDMNIARNLNIMHGDKPLKMQVFLGIQNMFNIRNIMGVFKYTGQPNDDGFLNSPQGQQAIQNQLSAQSYVDLYRIMLNSQTGNYGSPRIVRIGCRCFFN